MLMLDATTSFRTGRSASASSSTAVPTEFADVYSAISYIDWPTPTREARWTTESTLSSARRTAAASRTSPTTSGSTAAPSSCTCGTRLSSTRTRYPCRRSSSARCEPMKPAPPVMRVVSDSCGFRQPGGRAQRVRLVGALPREVAILAPEVAVRRRLRVDRPPQVEIAQDRRRTQVEVLADERLDARHGNRLCPERVDEDRHRVRHADRVCDLNLAPLREPRRDDVLRHVARRVRRRTVDLRRILARERAAAVRRSATVRVDDDLPARDAGVAHRAADDELARRVAVDEVLVLEPPLVVQLLREDRMDDVFDEIRLQQRLDVEPVAVLRRDEHALDLDRPHAAALVLLVAERHLRLPVRAQVGQDLGLAHLAQPLREPVREHDRQRHELVRLVDGVAEHHPLVASALTVERVLVAALLLVRVVDALRDVGRLLVDRDDDAACVGVEAELRARISDLGDLAADEPRDVDVDLGRDLAGYDDEAGRDQRLAGDAAVRVLGKDCVENGVGDLVGDLVRMTLGDRLGREGVAARHGRQASAPHSSVGCLPMRRASRSPML